MPEFYMIIARKIFFLNAPVSYAYAKLILKLLTELEFTMCDNGIPYINYALSERIFSCVRSTKVAN